MENFKLETEKGEPGTVGAEFPLRKLRLSDEEFTIIADSLRSYRSCIRAEQTSLRAQIEASIDPVERALMRAAFATNESNMALTQAMERIFRLILSGSLKV